MGYWTYTKDPIGVFVEKEVGNYFEFSNNDNPYGVSDVKDFPHKVWVGDTIGQGFRYANVKKTVAYIVTDEDEYGNPVVEKWFIKGKRDYVIHD